MILYNVTVSIDPDIHDDWLDCMKEVHIPDVLNTGLFFDNKICRIHAEEEGGISYSIQYLAKNWDNYNKYKAEFAPSMQKEFSDRYEGRFAAFRTLLEIVHHEQRTD